jgi:hypothetical protein
VFVLGSNAAGGNGSGAGITISAGQGVGTGSSGTININAGGPSLGTGVGTSILLTAGGSTGGTSGKIGLTTVDGVTASSITFEAGDNNIAAPLGTIGTVGLLASNSGHACHFASQQNTPPAISGVGARDITSSDMCGRITGLTAGATATITYHQRYPVGTIPFVVCTAVGVAGDTCVITASSNTAFNVTNNGNNVIQVNYIVMCGQHT